MKKILLIFVLFVLLCPIGIYAWDDCPFGNTDGSCTSACGRFIDINSDGICDHSQEEPTLLGEVAQAAGNDSGSGQSRLRLSSKYNFISLSFVLLIFYFVSNNLVKKKKISKINHQRIWNIFLTLSFLISGLLGLMLVARINYGWFSDWYSAMLYWHVEVGIAMTIVSIFHIVWHWPYYKCMFIKKDTCEDKK